MHSSLPSTLRAARQVAPQCLYRRAHGQRLLAAATQHAGLEEWVTAHGGIVNGVRLQGDSRQLVAVQDLAPGTTVLRIPKELQLRHDTVQDPRLLRLYERVPTGSDTGSGAWQFKQALLLLYHQALGPESPLSPHIQLLPGAPGQPSVPPVGMLLADEVVDELQYAPLVADIQNHKYWWNYFWEKELSTLAGTTESPFGSMPITKETFGASVAVVISRCFALRKAPLIDMVDHSLDSNCEVSSTDQGAMQMTTTATVPKGSPLLLTYGPHQNRHLLLSYGFVLPTNPNDRFMWTYDLEILVEVIQAMCGQDWVETPVADWKLELLARIGLPQPPSSSADGAAQAPEVAVGGDLPVDGRLLGAVRVLLSKDDARDLLQRMDPVMLCDWNTPVARQHELGVLRALISLTTSIYTSFPTTIQQDKAMLKALSAGSTNGSPAEREACRALIMAVTFRLGLKTSLEAGLLKMLQRSKELAAI